MNEEKKKILSCISSRFAEIRQTFTINTNYPITDFITLQNEIKKPRSFAFILT